MDFTNTMLCSLQTKINKAENELKILKKTFDDSLKVIQANCKHNEIKVNKDVPFCVHCGYNRIG